MTTIDQIRARHGQCAGPCDMAWMLAELEAAGQLLHTAHMANDKLRNRNDAQVQQIDHLVSSVISLREQRTYLVRRLREQAPPDLTWANQEIRRLRKTLANTRAMYANQLAATKRQKSKTRRVAGAAFSFKILHEQLHQTEADAAALRLALETIADQSSRPAGTLAADIAAGALANVKTGSDQPNDTSRVTLLAQRNNALYTALTRARAELEDLTGESHLWLDDVMRGGTPPIPDDRPLGVGEIAATLRAVHGYRVETAEA